MRRILHVTYNLKAGGPEEWLMRVLRRRDPARFQIDIFYHESDWDVHAEEAQALGAGLFAGPPPWERPFAFARHLKRVLAEHGPYDVVHCHLRLATGLVLRLADRAGVPIRIAHARNAPIHRERPHAATRLGMRLLERWLRRYATDGLAVNVLAAEALYGEGWRSDPRFRIYRTGFDFAPFHEPAPPEDVRRDLGLPDGAFVIGHAGRLEEVKNQAFLIHMLAKVIEREPRACLLLIGQGRLRSSLEQQAAEAGLADRVLLTGHRTDVPRLMLGAMDVFVLPSLSEGLPGVLVEAQAAGLPCVYSDVVTDEVEVVRPLMRTMSLHRPATAWAEVVLAARQTAGAVAPRDALAAMEQSDFNIANSMAELECLYEREAI